METRIPGSLDMSRFPESKGKLIADASLQGVADLALNGTSEPRDGFLAQNQADVVSREQLETAVLEMNEFIRTADREISFNLDDGSGRVVVNVTDRETGKMIRQIPSDEALKLAESLSEARSLLTKVEV